MSDVTSSEGLARYRLDLVSCLRDRGRESELRQRSPAMKLPAEPESRRVVIVRPGLIDPMTAVVQWVKAFAYYSLSFSRHNQIKMEHFLLYILSRYLIWLHKWKGFNDICASLKYETMIDYSFQLFLILYPLRCRETISLRGPVFHRSHGHNLVRPGHQSEVNYGYVSKICR